MGIIQRKGEQFFRSFLAPHRILIIALE